MNAFPSQFFSAVLAQEPEALRACFSPDAVIDWPCTDERFTVEEYVRANCEYPGDWTGEIERVVSAGEQSILAARVWPKTGGPSFHCVSFLRMKDGQIAHLTEYWSDDGPVPEWRKEFGIGSSLRGNNDFFSDKA